MAPLTGALLLAFTLVFLAVARAWLGRDEEGGRACSPPDVLHALQWEVQGKVQDGRFSGHHKDRALTIEVSGSSYVIEIEGIPAAGDLTGSEALALIEEQTSRVGAVPEIPDWDAIVRIFHAHPIRFVKGRLVCTADFGGGVLGSVEEAKRLKRLLDRLVEVTHIAQIALSLRSRRSPDAKCPYCHAQFPDRLQTTECPKCGALHHVECFLEHGKCAVFACSARITTPLRDLSGPGKEERGSIR